MTGLIFYISFIVLNLFLTFFKGDFMQSTIDPITVSSDEREEKRHLINDSNYHLLKQFQQDLFKEIELLPSMRKLVNELITAENLEKIKTKLINQWSA